MATKLDVMIKSTFYLYMKEILIEKVHLDDLDVYLDTLDT